MRYTPVGIPGAGNEWCNHMTDQPESEGNGTRAAPGEASRLAEFAERLRVREYIELLQRPGRLLWVSFLSGIGRGAGAAIGGVVVLALLGLIFSRIVNVPMIGKYLAGLVQEIKSHLPR
jgi:hypothetical protein